jgi:magnesium transporter
MAVRALYSAVGEQPVEVGTEAEISRLHRLGQGCLWVDLEAPSDEERGILERVFGFHRLAVENCLASSNHPRIDDYGDYLYMVFHGVVAAKGGVLTGGSRVGLVEVDVFLGPRFLLTYHAGTQSAIAAVRRKCQEVQDAMKRGPDRLLAELLDHMADEYVDLMEQLDEEIDTVEDRLFKHAPRPALREIFSLKKDVLHLRRVLNPQREVLNRLARSESKVVSKEETIYFRDVYDHIYRVSEMLESFRDVLTGAMEVYLTVVSNRTNEIMKVLTVFSIVLMSASLLAGLYGMNVPLPGAPGEGSRAAFYALLGIMVGAAGALFLFFRKRRWI